MGLTRIRENDMQISQFFVNGDIKGAIDYMRDHEEFKDISAGIFELVCINPYSRALRLTGGGSRRQTADSSLFRS